MKSEQDVENRRVMRVEKAYLLGSTCTHSRFPRQVGSGRTEYISEAEEESSIEITDNGIETRISTFALHIQLPADAAIVVPRRSSSLVKNCVNSPWMPEGAGPGAQKSRNPVQKTMHLG